MSGELMRIEFSEEQVDLIRRTICPAASDVELALFLNQCKRTGLDPFARQIHAVKRWDSQQQREVMAIQTGIDGFRLIAERTGAYAGNDDPAFDSEDGDHPNKATVTVWKMVAGQRVPFTRSARWREFVQTKKDGTPTKFWQKMPYLMLGKVAEALALRAAFPQELSGLYTSEEMGQADNDDHRPARSEPAHQPTTVAQLRQLPGIKSGADLQAPKQPAKVNPPATADEVADLCDHIAVLEGTEGVTVQARLLASLLGPGNPDADPYSLDDLTATQLATAAARCRATINSKANGQQAAAAL